MDRLIANEKRNVAKLTSYYDWCKNNENNSKLEINIPSIQHNVKTKYLIKKITAKEEEKPENLSNIVRLSTSNLYNKKIDYNAYIDIPYDFHACGYKWVTEVGKIIDKKMSKSCYANRLTNLENSSDIFKFFVTSYNEFRENALNTINDLFDKKEGVIVFNYDLTRYFYNINIDILFKKLDYALQNEGLGQVQKDLTDFVKNVIIKYNEIIPSNIEVKKMGLPIEFAPSNILSNLYLKDFDDTILSSNPQYYGRYVDDMIIVFKYIPGKDKIEDYIPNNLFKSSLDELELRNAEENEKIKTFIFDSSPKNKNVINIFKNYVTTFSSDFNKMLNIYDLESEINNNCYNTIGLDNKFSSIGEFKLKNIEFAKIISTIEYIIFNGFYEGMDSKKIENLFGVQIKFLIDSCDDSTLIERYDYWAALYFIEGKINTCYLEKRINNIRKKVNNEEFNVIIEINDFIIENKENYIKKKELSRKPKWQSIIKENMKKSIGIAEYQKIYQKVEEISFDCIENSQVVKIESSVFKKEEFNIGIVSIPQKHSDYLKEFLIHNDNEGYISQIWDNCVKSFNACIKSKVDIVVFPEHSISMKNLPYIVKKAVNSNIIIVGGIVPQICKNSNTIINQLVTIIPYDYNIKGTEDEPKEKKMYKDAFIYFRDKVHFAPEEVEIINGCTKKYNYREGEKIDIALFDINDKLKMVNYNCFELYDYECRNKFNGMCNFITASVNNKDIDAFRNILYSLRIDAFSFVAQSNYSEFGDSMLITPKGNYRKEIMNIKGSEKVEVVVASINIKELEEAKLHNEIRRKHHFKPLPPHFKEKK